MPYSNINKQRRQIQQHNMHLNGARNILSLQITVYDLYSHKLMRSLFSSIYCLLNKRQVACSMAKSETRNSV